MKTYWKVGPSIGGINGCLSGFSARPPIHRSTSFKPVAAAAPLIKAVELCANAVSVGFCGANIALPPEPEPFKFMVTYPVHEEALVEETSNDVAVAAVITALATLQPLAEPVMPDTVTC